MNARWHLAHPMPSRATLAQRITWHRAHARTCACRSLPAPLRAQMIVVELPAELGAALRTQPAAHDRFAAQGPTRQRAYAAHVAAARTPATRRRRAAETVAALLARRPTWNA